MKNVYEIRGEVTAIFIKTNKHGTMEALISTRQLEKVKQFPNAWYPYYSRTSNSFYVFGRTHGKFIHLHRWITDAPTELVVDHINHNTLDNTDPNLRVCSRSENQFNRSGPTRRNKSGERGVCWVESCGKWSAKVKYKGKWVYQKWFTDFQEAVTEVRKARARVAQERGIYKWAES